MKELRTHLGWTQITHATFFLRASGAFPALTLVCGLTCFAQAPPAKPAYQEVGDAFERLLQSRRYEELASELAGAAELKPEQQKYFQGALAMRQNRLADANHALRY